jgi:hypothetical protein
MIKMEKITFIDGKDRYLKYYKNLIDRDQDYKKMMFYTESLHTFSYCTRKETETHIYWADSTKTPRVENDKFFYQHKNVCGATYDKNKKTIKVWFGKRFCNLPISTTMDIINMLFPWFNTNVDSSRAFHGTDRYLPFLNSRILNKIVKGKITSTEEIFEHYLKSSSFRNLNLDVKLFEKFMQSGYGDSNRFQYKVVLLAAKNPNETLVKISNSDFNDCYFQKKINFANFSKLALAINKKVDVNWTDDEMVSKCQEYEEELNIKKEIYKGFGGEIVLPAEVIEQLHTVVIDDLPF